MSRRFALIAGASGFIGRRLGEQLLAKDAWRVVGLCRRPPARPGPFPLLSVDLTDAVDCRRQLSALQEITHVFYCARYDHHASEREPVDINAAMLANLVEAVEPIAASLEHVHVVHGTKYYGSHLGPFKVPAREDDPRATVKNFYHVQQGFLVARQRGKQWNWSVSRPHAFCDDSPEVARNLPMVFAVFAMIMRELGKPLCFPGTLENFNAIYQVTEIRHLARAIEWMATEPRCANQAFNITNGDSIRWADLWPKFAGYFGLMPGPVRTIRLAEFMANKEFLWQRIIEKYALNARPLRETALWPYADFVFAAGYDIISDTTKAREFGFHERVDSARMFERCFYHFRSAKAIA